jgi:hypothetical protein
MYEEEIMAISILCVVFVLPLLCMILILIKNLCINRRENTDDYSPVPSSA